MAPDLEIGEVQVELLKGEEALQVVLALAQLDLLHLLKELKVVAGVIY